MIEITPGMVKTDEFSNRHSQRDLTKAESICAGVREPLSADDAVECTSWR